jgi:hypothetical protein
MKNAVLRGATPCRLLKVDLRFGVTYLRRLQGRREAALFPICFHFGSFLLLFFDPDDGSDMFLRNVGSLPIAYTALYTRTHYT